MGKVGVKENFFVGLTPLVSHEFPLKSGINVDDLKMGCLLSWDGSALVLADGSKPVMGVLTTDYIGVAPTIVSVYTQGEFNRDKLHIVGGDITDDVIVGAASNNIFITEVRD